MNENRSFRTTTVYVEMVMKIQIIGSSAIEDKLQAGVADAISDLMAAGIRIWVLTGDK